MHVRHALPFVVLLVSTLFGAVAIDAQTIIVYEVDASAFPTIRAKLAVLDERGNRVPNVTAADLSILENGLPVTDITVDCPPLVPPQPFHAVLVNDRSGSMTIPVGSGMTRMDLAKLGSSEFVRASAFSSGTTIAVTAFGSTSAIVSDFQTSAPPLLSAIGTITASGGTLYNPPFLDPLSGAIGMLSGRPVGARRVIVFLTDGEPNEATLTTEIVTAARNEGIQVYAVTLGMPMSGDLNLISNLTNGLAFGDVSTVEQMRGVYQQIALSAGGNEPCILTWKSRIGCGQSSRDRIAIVTHLPTAASTRVRFTTPESSVGGIDAEPSFVHFGLLGPPDELERIVVLRSPNDSMLVDRAAIVPVGAFTVVDWGGTEPPFRDPPGTTRTIRVKFAPPDSLKYVASLVLYGGSCPPFPITLTGGVGPEDGTSLRLLSPLGGESFSGCDSILIRWGGVAITTPIDIEASSDDGATWQLVATGATGLEYLWMAPSPGLGWRIRITSKEGSDQHLIMTAVGGGASSADSIQATTAQLYSPTGVAVRGDSMFIAEAGQHRIRRVDLTSGRITTIAGDGNPGLNGAVVARLARLNGPSHVLLYGTYLFIADYGNHSVRRINLSDGRIFSVAGTGASGFSGDSADALSAELYFPSYLAVSGSTLYISDAGNLRVRAIDFTTGAIVTIAGGGASTVDDIQATTALLQAPAGIAADERYLYIAEDLGRRIRRVDLRTGLITTLAGTGGRGSTGDGGQASVATFMNPLGLRLDGGFLYVTDSAAHRVRRIDLVTGVITTIAGTGAPAFGGDGGDATLARLNGPGQPDAADGFLYVPDIFNGRIRAISIGRGPGADSSRSSFAVNVARLGIGITDRRFALGSIALGQPRDSALVGALCSVGDRPLVIESVRIAGTHAADFRVVAGAPSSEIAPGSCAPLEIRFRPSGLGTRTAMAILTGHCANADTVWLSGIGVDSCGAQAIDLADVGEIVLGAAARDTIVQRALCNTGDKVLSGFARLVDGTIAFEMIGGAGAFTLAPGQCHTVTVRFAPTASGRVTGEIDYGMPAACGAARTRLYGRALGSPELATSSLVTMPSVLCAASRDTTLLLANTGGAPLVITGATIVANDEGFALLPPAPTPSLPLTIAPGESASLALRFAPATPGDKTALLELVSNSDGSPHRIDLRGRRERIELVATPLISLPSDGRPVPLDTTVAVINTGTVAVEIASASLAGDAASFDVPAAQFPIMIEAGAAASVAVRLMSAPTDVALRARLTLAYGPTCDSGRVAVELLAAGSAPELVSVGPVFRALVCPDETTRDTTIMLRNAGQDTLRIASMTIANDASLAFTIVDGGPFTIGPGSDTLVTVRFSTTIPGDHTADLVIASNAPRGTETIAMRARRERIELTSTPQRMTLAGQSPGVPIDGSVTVVNGGTSAIQVTVTSLRGVVIVTDGVRTIGAEGSAAFAVRYVGIAGGRFFDTLVVREALCGTELRIPVEIFVDLPAVVRVTLPNVIARPGDRVSLPVTIAITDPERFATSGARAYTATVSMYGTVIVPDGVTGATIAANDYDLTTRRQTVVFTGEYFEGDALASITGRTILGDTLGSPLTFESFVWDKPSVGAELVDGSLTIVGSCLDLGLRLVAVPSILKVRPMPASGTVTLELALEEWNSVRVVLYDSRGLPVAELAQGTLEAGQRSLALDVSDVAAGTYSLAVETVYGRSVVAVVIAR